MRTDKEHIEMMRKIDKTKSYSEDWEDMTYLLDYIKELEEDVKATLKVIEYKETVK